MIQAAEVLRSNQQLQQFVLPNVTPTGRTLETGSFGVVQVVEVKLMPSARELTV